MSEKDFPLVCRNCEKKKKLTVKYNKILEFIKQLAKGVVVPTSIEQSFGSQLALLKKSQELLKEIGE